MPEPLFERLYRETTTMNWQPTEDIRRRGERRAARHRLTIAASAFVAVVVLVSVAVYTWRPLTGPVNIGSTTPPATTAATSAPPTGTMGTTPPPAPATTVPEAALLQPADTDGTPFDPDRPRGDWSLGYTLGTCPAKVPESGHTSISSAGRSFQYAEGPAVLQQLDAYGPGDAEREFAWFRAKIAACRTFEQYGVTINVRIVAESLGGNESLLVETASKNGTNLFIVVRAGNLLTEILASKFKQADAQVLGQRAAGRMCPITKTC